MPSICNPISKLQLVPRYRFLEYKLPCRNVGPWSQLWEKGKALSRHPPCLLSLANGKDFLVFCNKNKQFGFCQTLLNVSNNMLLPKLGWHLLAFSFTLLPAPFGSGPGRFMGGKTTLATTLAVKIRALNFSEELFSGKL